VETYKELSIVELIRVLARYKAVAASVGVVVLALSVVVALLSTPIYRAETVLSPAEAGSQASTAISSIMSQVSGFLPVFGSGQRGRVAKGEALATLASPAFIGGFIQDKNLLPVLFASRWDGEAGEWGVDSEEDIPTLNDGVGLFLKEILFLEEAVDLSGLVTLAIEWRDPVVAASWANELVKRLNRTRRVQAIRDADQMIEFLNEELTRTQIVALQQSIYLMIENQISVKTMANVREEFSFKVLSPAVAPDADNFIRPQRLFIIAFGLVLSVAVGIAVAFLVYGFQRVRGEIMEGNRERAS